MRKAAGTAKEGKAKGDSLETVYQEIAKLLRRGLPGQEARGRLEEKYRGGARCRHKVPQRKGLGVKRQWFEKRT
jgi:hypothetical protein